VLWHEHRPTIGYPIIKKDETHRIKSAIVDAAVDNNAFFATFPEPGGLIATGVLVSSEYNTPAVSTEEGKMNAQILNDMAKPSVESIDAWGQGGVLPANELFGIAFSTAPLSQ
jgi:hypothetical protein